MRVMGKAACTIKQTEITRVLKAAKKAGVDVQVQIDLERKTMTITPVNVSEADTGVGNGLDQWMNKHARATEGH
jgi:hypothetical protein